MSNLFKFYVLAITLCFAISCSPTLNYVGNKYASTTNVKLYFDPTDIKREYEVMGIVKNDGGEFEIDDSESVQNAMIKKAKEVGADAILFEGYATKEVDSYNSAEYRNTNVTTTHTDRTTSDIYRAKFIKYK